MLEVVRQVNKKAKNWDSGHLKEITMLEVGNPEAQDQRSLAKGEQLTKAAGYPLARAGGGGRRRPAAGGGGGRPADGRRWRPGEMGRRPRRDDGA